MRYLISYFIKFKKFVGVKIYYLLFLVLIVGFVEGLGVTLFLPVLQGGFGSDKISKMLEYGFNLFHIKYSFTLALAFILIFFILRTVFILYYARYFGKVSSNLIVTLRRKVLNGIFAADYLYLLKKEIGYINNAMVREVARVIDAFDKFSATLNYVLYGLVYAALAMLLNFKVVVAVTILSPAIIIVMRRINFLTTNASLDSTFSHGKFNSTLIQALSKFKYLKATSAHREVSKIVDKENERLGRLKFRLFFLQALARNLFEPLIIFIIVGILFYYVIILGRNVNEVIFLSFLFLQLARQFLSVQMSYRKFLASMGSIETFNNFEKELEANKENLNLNGLLPDFNKEIIFKNASVVFPNGKRAIEDVNITIKPRSVTALVGHSGSGKSTIANMVTGMLKPTDGKVSFGCSEYSQINLKALREKIGYVTQEDIIFNASIKDNIALWEENADENRLANVIRMAHITGFMKDLPEGENSMLGDNGLDVSGGQRQRITIARELYKDTKFLILDEATSSLDSKFEKQIYENLKEFKGNKTMLVIAHRLSTIKNADYIYVLDRGKIIEEGTYEVLCKKNGDFKRMIDDQTLVLAGD